MTSGVHQFDVAASEGGEHLTFWHFFLYFMLLMLMSTQESMEFYHNL